MARILLLFQSLFVVSVSSAVVAAQEWPIYPINGHHLERGSGGYLSLGKLAALIGLYLLWVKTTDWVNRDTQILELPHVVWNGVNFFPYVVAFILFFVLLPAQAPFVVGFVVSLLAWVIPLGVYIFNRNANVEAYEKVLTPAHFRQLFARVGKGVGVAIDSEKKAAYEKGPPVEFTALGGKDPQADQANIILARQSDGFIPAKHLVSDAIDRRAEKVMLDFGRDLVAVRYQIDGVWHEADPQEREAADSLLNVFKHLSALDTKERRQRQLGKFQAVYRNRKFKTHIVSQGTKTGERVVLHFVTSDIPFKSLGELGMRDKMQEQLKELLGAKHGFFLFSAIPGGGLTSTMVMSLKLTDRYMRDITSFQDLNNPEPLAENIDLQTYDPGKESALQRLTTVLRKEPDVIVVHDLVDGEMVKLLATRAKEDKLVIAAIRAKEAVEALLRVLLLKVPAKEFAPLALGVLNQRLVRTLCEDCKEAYTPPPDVLKKLGVPAGRVDEFYRPPEPDTVDKPCKKCGGLGYLGRTSIFELLEVNDALRATLIKEPKLEALRKVARQSGHRSLQDEGVVLVAKGITSLQELMRVMKE